MTALHCAPRPCSTCPYRTDTPPGVWDRSEYTKLPDYDGTPGALATFHCHQEHSAGIPTVCRGWLTVHADGIAVRLAIARGEVTPAQRDAPVDVELYATGEAAARAGLAGVDDPSPTAVDAICKLTRRLPLSPDVALDRSGPAPGSAGWAQECRDFGCHDNPES